MLNLLNTNRNAFAPTKLLRKWVATGDARCPLVCVWHRDRGPAKPASISRAADSTSEYALCA